MHPRIFIGGSGKSGTSILNKTIGCHNKIHSFPGEMRFLVDPYGLISLLDGLTTRFSIPLATEYFFRFEILMKVHLTFPIVLPYRGHKIHEWIGVKYYWHRLEQFCLSILCFEFEGSMKQSDPAIRKLIRYINLIRQIKEMFKRRTFFVPKRLELSHSKVKVPRYFSNREELITLCRDFVDDLFLYAAKQRGKQTWCEKTPANILQIAFLSELFPGHVFIHIKRDPRGVAYSFNKKRWGHNINDNCLRLRNFYQKWFDIKKNVDFSKINYLEIKLEDFANNPMAVLNKITETAGLNNSFNNIPDVNLEKVNYWKTEMKNNDIKTVNDILGFYIEEMGYKI